MVLTPILHAGATMIRLIIRAGVVTSMIVGGQTMRAEITFAEKTLQRRDSVVMFVFMQDSQSNIPMAVLEAGVRPVGVDDDDL